MKEGRLANSTFRFVAIGVILEIVEGSVFDSKRITSRACLTCIIFVFSSGGRIAAFPSGLPGLNV